MSLIGVRRRQSNGEVGHGAEGKHRLFFCDSCVARQSVVFDAIFVEPAWTGDGEERACCSLQRRDRARAVARRLIDDEVQCTRARLADEGEDHFEAPVANEWILEKQLIGGGEVGGVSSYISSIRREREEERFSYRKTRCSRAERSG